MTAIWTHRILTWIGWGLIGAWTVWVFVKIFFSLSDLPYLWQALVAGIAMLLVRGLASGEVIRRMYLLSQPGTGTITRLKYRGSWGTGSEDATQYHWFDVWFRVVPAASSGLAPFEGFSRVSRPMWEKDRLAEGLTVPVLYDPPTGITVPTLDGGINSFATGKTIRMAARMRRRSRRGIR